MWVVALIVVGSLVGLIAAYDTYRSIQRAKLARLERQAKSFEDNA